MPDSAPRRTWTTRFVGLENGGALDRLDVDYRTWGRLNEAGDNTVVVCHSLTGDSDVTSWWPGIIGRGRALDPDRHFIVCANLLGSCYGTTGPASIDSATGQPYASRFPIPTVRDNVRLQYRLLRHLGVQRVDTVIGGSLGGMLALEFAFLGPYVRRIVPVATSGRHSAWCIAWTESQRQAIYADPNWHGGEYAPDAPPERGLAAARMMAMLSYRTPGSFENRFARTLAADAGPGTRSLFNVESYLHHQGDKLVRRFDANSYVRLSQTSNTHDVARGRGRYEDVLASIRQPALVIGIDTDGLFPVREQEELARYIPRAELAILRSDHGHDGFLLESNQLDAVLKPWLERTILRPLTTRKTLQPCASI